MTSLNLLKIYLTILVRIRFVLLWLQKIWSGRKKTTEVIQAWSTTWSPQVSLVRILIGLVNAPHLVRFKIAIQEIEMARHKFVEAHNSHQAIKYSLDREIEVFESNISNYQTISQLETLKTAIDLIIQFLNRNTETLWKVADWSEDIVTEVKEDLKRCATKSNDSRRCSRRRYVFQCPFSSSCCSCDC